MAKRKRGRTHAYEGSEPPAKKQHVDSIPLPEGVHHYQSLDEVPWDIQKYWHQGYSIFSKYDDGIWMTDDAWFGVTHESVAEKIAEHVAAARPPERAIIVDLMCGVGGNAIAFAKSGQWKRVYAIEKDPATLACARHNAEIYGVADQITFFEGDCMALLGLEKGDKKPVDVLGTVIGKYGVLFVSPPWGGPGYVGDEVFNLDTMLPYSATYLQEMLLKVAPFLVMYLPRNSNLVQIGSWVGSGKQTQVVHYCTNRTSRALCAYLGAWGTLE